jgi:hypothetical protein
VKERNELVGRQSEQVKTLIWLMTWWSWKQNWTSSLAASNAGRRAVVYVSELGTRVPNVDTAFERRRVQRNRKSARGNPRQVFVA